MSAIIQPGKETGWSEGVEPPGEGDELLTEFDVKRQLLVIRFRRGLSLPVYVPIPLPAMLGMCGMILTQMAGGAVGPVTAHTNPEEHEA